MAELPPNHQNLGFFRTGAGQAMGTEQTNAQQIAVAQGVPFTPTWTRDEALQNRLLSEALNTRAFREAIGGDPNTFVEDFRRHQMPTFLQQYVPHVDGPMERVPQPAHRTTTLGKRRRNPREETLPPRGVTSGGLISTAIEWGQARVLGLTAQQRGGSSLKFPDISMAGPMPEIAPGYATGRVDNSPPEWEFEQLLAAAGINVNQMVVDPQAGGYDELDDDNESWHSEDGPARWDV